MKIISFEVSGLLGAEQPLSISLNSDLNILTGKNGSGKTSILKLMWYMISGNILLALREIPFQRATLITDTYECVLIKLGIATCKVELTPVGGAKAIFEDREDEDGDTVINAEDLANPQLMEHGVSV